MLSVAERHKYIKERLAKDGYIRVLDMAEALNVTGATIRKDLRILESQGILYRTHGSATPVKPHVVDLSVDVKSSKRMPEKQAISRAAQTLILPDDDIILASGSTVTAFAEYLTPVNSLNVVTSAPIIAVLLNGKEHVKVFLLGGEMYKNSFSTRGAVAESCLANVSCSKLFIGVDGIDPASGITCSNLEEARLNSAMMKVASQTVVLADSSKFGCRGFGKICNLEDIDIIITDAGVSEQFKAQMEEAGVQVIIAQ